MTRFAVGLGSNLGDRDTQLRRAVAALAGSGEVVAISSLYETAPVGGPEQGPYLNAVTVLETDLDAHALLGVCRRIEAEGGRVRDRHWGPRTLDLDIIATDGPVVASADLEVPHPRARHRRFVLEPLAEVWPDSEVGPGVTALQALTWVGDQQVDLVAREWLAEGP